MQASPDDIRPAPAGSRPPRRIVAAVVLAHLLLLGGLLLLSRVSAPVDDAPHVQLVAISVPAPRAAAAVVPVRPPGKPAVQLPVPVSTTPPPAPSAAPVADAPPAVVPTVPAVAASGGTTPAVAVPPAPVRVGPAFLHTSTPAYPEELRRAGVEGSVVVVVHVDTDGRPQTVSVERSSGHVQFDRNAVEAVRRDYRFRPAREDDRAVEADVRFTVPFRLSE